jgi:two-component sensor histidine kinase
VIYSLLNLQAKNIADPSARTLLEEARNRINAMVLVHEKLYRSTDLAHIDFKEYLKDLISGIVSTFKRQNVVLSLDMEPLALDVTTGIPCGLIVNELATNSLKHAFPDGRAGTITVTLGKNREGGYVLIVADNGVGFPANVDFRNSASLGLQLVNVLTGQIYGKIELSREAGTKFSITFPGAVGHK